MSPNPLGSANPTQASLTGHEGGALMPPPLPVVDLTDPGAPRAPATVEATVSGAVEPAVDPTRLRSGQWLPIPRMPSLVDDRAGAPGPAAPSAPPTQPPAVGLTPPPAEAAPPASPDTAPTPASSPVTSPAIRSTPPPVATPPPSPAPDAPRKPRPLGQDPVGPRQPLGSAAAAPEPPDAAGAVAPAAPVAGRPPVTSPVIIPRDPTPEDEPSPSGTTATDSPRPPVAPATAIATPAAATPSAAPTAAQPSPSPAAAEPAPSTPVAPDAAPPATPEDASAATPESAPPPRAAAPPAAGPTAAETSATTAAPTPLTPLTSPPAAPPVRWATTPPGPAQKANGAGSTGPTTNPADAVQAARQARAEALGEIAPTPEVIAAPPLRPLPSTYKKLPSLALAFLRLVVLALFAGRAWLDLRHLDATIATWRASVLPDAYASQLAYTQVGLEIAIAVLLLFGLGTRVAGALMIVFSTAALVFLLWGVGSPWDAAGSGVAFAGEFQVLLAAAGLVFLGVGGGGWLSFDAFLHRQRIARKNQKVS